MKPTWYLVALAFIVYGCSISDGLLHRCSAQRAQSVLRRSPEKAFPMRASLFEDTKVDAFQMQDEEVFTLIQQEWWRQSHGLELIASENFVSEAVLSALGSCLTNKYSEGRPGQRYYGGNQFIDAMEQLCERRALTLFRLSPEQWSVNVQPYSGSPANFAVYTALLQPHDRIMGLDLPSGGHLTHGYQTLKRKVSATSIFFESMPYRVHPDTGLIDYDEMESLALLFKPKLLIAGASAYSRDWDYARMRRIADRVDAFLMADMAHISGLVATGLCNNPFEHCDVVTSTTHKSLRGPRSGMIFSRKVLSDKVNSAVFPGLQGGPHNHQIAAVAVALKEAATPEFTTYIQQVLSNAKALSQALQSYGYHVVTGGTDNHIVLWDLRRGSAAHPSRSINGAVMQKLCELCEVSVNKNSVPGDTSALSPGGVRLGTLAMTTRGMCETDMVIIADLLHRIYSLAMEIQGDQDKLKVPELLDRVSQSIDLSRIVEGIKKEVETFSSQFFLPGRGKK